MLTLKELEETVLVMGLYKAEELAEMGWLKKDVLRVLEAVMENPKHDLSDPKTVERLKDYIERTVLGDPGILM